MPGNTNQRLAEALRLVYKQSSDSGLWVEPTTATEAYLQQELRKLHAAIEGEPIRFRMELANEQT